MYHGTNPIALQSQQWLTESLVALMKKKHFSQITIYDICKKADLSRQTFYNFFKSKEEILHFAIRQKYETQFSKYAQKRSITIDEIIAAFSSVLTENKSLLSSMLENDLDGIIVSEMSRCVSLFADHFINEETADKRLPYSKALLSGALANLLVYWFKESEPISIHQLTSLLKDFFSGQLYTLDGNGT